MEARIERYDSLPQHDVEIDGMNVHVIDVGHGPPVVLVHGSPTSSLVFRHQIEALAPEFRVVAPDLPGFGQSSAPAGGASFSQQASVLGALLDRLRLEPYALLGHDWGGPVAMACAARRPEQVSRLILANTTIVADFRPPWYWAPIVAPIIGELLVLHLNLFGRGLPLMMRAARDKSLRRRYLDPTRRAGTRRTMLSLERLTGYRALMEQVERALPKMRVPTLVLWGEPDYYFRPAELERLHRLLPQAAVEKIPEAGHFLQEDAAEAVTNALLRFLRQAS